ncbi:MAG: hypothetical protein KAG97_07925, partial [Victivallales bacterium]|nr:hypothetical protein [Victivallales bacterium]
FLHPDDPNTLISTIPILDFADRRYAPYADWKIVAAKIAEWLSGEWKEITERGGIGETWPGEKNKCSILNIQSSIFNGGKVEADERNWKDKRKLDTDRSDCKSSGETLISDAEMSVRPAYSLGTVLPENAEQDIFDANASWFEKHVFYEQSDKIAVSEGFISGIDHNGRQSPRPPTRADCQGESAMIPALKWALEKDHPSRKTTAQIMDFLFNGGKLRDIDPNSPTYGGLYFYEHLPVFYSDDNCRASMACVLASELTGNFDFAPEILRCLLMILRSTGRLGFRRGRLDKLKSFENGETWKTYADEKHVEYRPHYQAYMWAGFLQAYVLTEHREFRDKAVNAIRMTMENAFPAKLAWTNGITQEYARILLPLAFLVEIEDTSEHRGWLKTATETLLENMSDCGAIREMMGNLKYGKYPSPSTNEEYGSTEAALIQENGDPACDLVYTVNYAFIGLHEAAMATGDAYYRDAVEKMADFLCRIQARSKKQYYLDGCWLRGFDYELWDYYGSSADNGWGAWCVESGWTNSWIGATFGLRLLNRPLLCRDSAPKYREIFPEILKEMSILREYRANPSSIAPKTIAPGAE